MRSPSAEEVGIPHLRDQRTEEHPCVVLGGQAGMQPAIFDPIVDVTCVGEGRAFLRTMVAEGVQAAKQLPNAWVPGETRRVVPDEEFPWDAPPTKAEDGIVRVYGSRGCKKKCLFCQVGWQVKYAENSDVKLLRQVRSLRAAGYKVNVVTNDAPALSYFSELGTMEHFSASYSQTRQLLSETGTVDRLKGKVRSVRFGVEAPSSRLRKWVGKPIETRDLYELTVALLSAGIGVRWFMIAGLPGETDEDYDELREVVQSIRHDARKGALQLSFTAFCTDPAAPLCLAPVRDDYWDRYDAFHKWFFDQAYTRRCQLFRCAGPESRMRHCIGSMGCSEAELRRGFA